VFDTGDDWRGFTPDELATVLDTLRNGGYTVAAAA
jgi:tRNA(Met) C34 N-acetyltransferase TmcA